MLIFFPRNICDHASLPRIEKRETRALSLEQALRSLVELKGGIIESKPKSSRGYRSVILPPFALEALKKHRERQRLMRREALLVKAELPDFRFHDLRHSVATLLLELGTHRTGRRW